MLDDLLNNEPVKTKATDAAAAFAYLHTGFPLTASIPLTNIQLAIPDVVPGYARRHRL